MLLPKLHGEDFQQISRIHSLTLSTKRLATKGQLAVSLCLKIGKFSEREKVVSNGYCLETNMKQSSFKSLGETHPAIFALSFNFFLPAIFHFA